MISIKTGIKRKSINIDEWRKQTNQPPLNPPSSTIVGTMDLPKHDPVKLQSDIEKFQLPF